MFSLRTSSLAKPSGRYWTEVGSNGEILPVSRLLFPSMVLNLYSEHDPPSPRGETFRSSSGQKSNSLALSGEDRRTPETTEFGEIQDSHTEKVQLVVGVKKGSVWSTHSGLTGLLCLYRFKFIAYSASSDVGSAHRKPGSVLCFMVWDPVALWLDSLEEFQVMWRKQEGGIRPQNKQVLGFQGTAGIKVTVRWS